MSVITFSGV